MSADTERRILHCDMDSFYASVHVRDEPELAGKPVIIGGSPEGRGVVAAASYEVRKFGVHSAMPAARAKRLCPDAIFIRPDFTRYRDESTKIFEIFHRYTELVQPVSIDEAYLDVSDTWSEWGSATAVAQAIRNAVKTERRLTVSVGVAPNRLLAKIASDVDKPDGLTVIKPRQVLGFLAPLSVRKLPGVGPATAARLQRVGIETVAELRSRSLEFLTERFGRHGRGMYNYARGIDERPVRTHGVRKSLSSENTFAEDLVGLEAMDEQLDRLARSVARGLQKRELRGRTITVKVRYPDFTTVTRSKTFPAPVADEALIVETARELLRKSDAEKRNVRLLGVGASNLASEEVAQMTLFRLL